MEKLVKGQTEETASDKELNHKICRIWKMRSNRRWRRFEP